ncbi:hypothetical protein LAZ67_7000263 [Cordylochernes scorpioides]|uniref:Reverse transcriptase domain-containing protein n=1 Tax=Cordylochernes scorpioides TaxID=51811 RepID=A0ABY6KLH9_9ARAC|nr:hypothetical protein LAZ67_7000263 [Cordylochernes scorpioides]
MCSFDVVSLYLSLPHQLIIESVTEFLIDLNTDITIIKKIEKLCRLCLNMNVFSFDGQWFQQIGGSPMGSPLSTVVAELVMSRLDRWINSQHASDLIFWRRYIDDIFCICSKDKVTSILNTLNKSENNNVLPFLDILIIRTSTKFHTTVFYKKHMNPSYTHYTSFCPISHKITVVKTLTKRIFTHCSLPCFKTIEQTNITNHLTALAHKLNKYGIATYFSTHANLGSLLRNPITKNISSDPLSKSNAIYSVKCNQCNATYVGETSRTIETRLKEHERNIRYKDNRSLIYQHTSTTGHTFNLKQVIAHYHDIERKQQRLFLEALSYCLNPDIHAKRYNFLKFVHERIYNMKLQEDGIRVPINTPEISDDKKAMSLKKVC